jgi:hypothetical protein
LVICFLLPVTSDGPLYETDLAESTNGCAGGAFQAGGENE